MDILVIDFETTGLNYRHDEPIQLAMIHYNLATNRGRTRSSYLKPTRVLSRVVSHITSLSQQDLECAPCVMDVIDDIRDFLLPLSTFFIVGHNISFDMDRWHHHIAIPLDGMMIDTYECARLTMPYQTSYALDQLSYKLDCDIVYLNILDTLKIQCAVESSDDHHDALTDCLRSLALALWSRDCVTHCRERYSYFLGGLHYLDRSCSPYVSFFLDDSNSFDSSPSDIYNLPTIVSPIPSSSRVRTDQSSNNMPTKFFSPSGNLESTIASLLASRGDRLLCFAVAHSSKLSVLASYIKKYYSGIIGRLHPDQRIDQDQRMIFAGLSDKWGWDEWAWCIKWCIHHQRGLKVFDAHTSSEKRIMSFLNTPIASIQHPIVLTSHYDFYQRCMSLDPQTHVIFLDADWWYSTFNTSRKRVIDMYQLGGLIEDCLWLLDLYDDPNRGYRHDREQDFWVMVGQWNHMRASWLSSCTASPHILHRRDLHRDDHTLAHCDRIINDLPAFADCMIGLQSGGKEYARRLRLFYQHWYESYDCAMTLNSHHTSTDDLWYTLEYHPRFSDFSELEGHMGLLGSDHGISRSSRPLVSYCSLTKNNPSRPGHSAYHFSQLPKRSLSLILNLCNHYDTLFILSVDKTKSQQIWSQTKDIDGIHSLCEAENISSGYKKILSLAGSEKKRIIVGGYSCLMSLWGLGLCPFIVEGYITGPLGETVRRECVWYITER